LVLAQPVLIVENNPLNFFLMALLLLLLAACSKEPDSSALKDESAASGNAGNAMSKENRHAEGISNEQKAQSDTPKAVEPEPLKSLDSMFLDMGLVLHKDGRDAEAREAFEDALLYNPRNAPCLSNLGNYEFLDGNYAGAKEYYQQAVDADPNFGFFPLLCG